jgi:hypothetical protein
MKTKHKRFSNNVIILIFNNKYRTFEIFQKIYIFIIIYDIIFNNNHIILIIIFLIFLFIIL